MLEKVAATRSEIRLDVILRGLRFDGRLTDPREKVGRVFHMDKVLEKHGVVGVFPEIDIAKHKIIRTVEPKELRERIEFEINTEEGRE